MQTDARRAMPDRCLFSAFALAAALPVFCDGLAAQPDDAA
jgi:hypothetical protein